MYTLDISGVPNDKSMHRNKIAILEYNEMSTVYPQYTPIEKRQVFNWQDQSRLK